jgi:hypothetical protein
MDASTRATRKLPYFVLKLSTSLFAMTALKDLGYGDCMMVLTPKEVFEDELTELAGAAREVEKNLQRGNKEEMKRWAKFLEQDIFNFVRKWGPKDEH